MSEVIEPRLRQLVDWSAAVWAGVLGGTLFLLVNTLLVPAMYGGNAWVVIRLLASPILGPDVLAPPSTFDATALAVALAVHFTLSILFAFLLAYVLHRFGWVVGVLGGGLMGLCLYAANLYGLTLLFPWFWAMNTPSLLLSHVLFGAVVGGVYEALEVEIFVSDEEEAHA